MKNVNGKHSAFAVQDFQLTSQAHLHDLTHMVSLGHTELSHWPMVKIAKCQTCRHFAILTQQWCRTLFNWFLLSTSSMIASLIVWCRTWCHYLNHHPITSSTQRSFWSLACGRYVWGCVISSFNIRQTTFSDWLAKLQTFLLQGRV